MCMAVFQIFHGIVTPMKKFRSATFSNVVKNAAAAAQTAKTGKTKVRDNTGLLSEETRLGSMVGDMPKIIYKKWLVWLGEITSIFMAREVNFIGYDF
mmetsp:Transcript_17851/g.32313  ORF Transcript_17851/g.32313 Transcript_17851/m.32313 type:complete len:97 (+) Transcript_17851:1076-1366(+)